MKLRIVQCNCQGLLNKKDFAQIFLKSFNVSIFCVNEVHTKSPISFDDYITIRNDRSDRRGGGVAIFVHNSLTINDFNSITVNNIEIAYVDIKLKKSFLRIVTCYCPPCSAMTATAIKSFYIKDKTIICGDFNAKHQALGSVGENSNGIKLVELLSKFDINLLSDGSPTHTHYNGSSDQLDLFLCSDKLSKFSSSVEILPEFAGSDHLPILLEFDTVVEPAYPIKRLNIRRADWEKLSNIVDDEIDKIRDEIAILTCNILEQIDFTASKIISSIDYAIKQSIPLCDAKSLKNWSFNLEILFAIKFSRKCRRVWMRTGDRVDKYLYNKASKVVCCLTRAAAFHRFRNECNNTNALLYKKPRLFWQKVRNSIDNSNVTIARPLKDLCDPNCKIYNNKDKANLFANYLYDVFNIHSGKQFSKSFEDGVKYYLKQNEQDLFPRLVANKPVHPMCIVTVDEVEAIIVNLFFKAPGIDNISNTIIRHLSRKFIIFLTEFFNLILKHGYFPQILKKAVIVMIPKPNKDHSTCKGYRPISLLPTISKILERILALRLYNKLEELHVIPPFQAAFRMDHSTDDHNFRLSQCVSQGFACNEDTVLICLDNEGAFDRVWPDGLRIRMLDCVLPRDFIRVMSNFIDGRSFCVRVANSHSYFVSMRAGVPQGSSLSPILYSLLVANLFTGISVNIYIGNFADDIALWKTCLSRASAVREINIALEHVYRWMCRYKQKINPEKSQAICFTKKGFPDSNSKKLVINGTFVEWRKNIIYLGVNYDYLQNWNAQFIYMSKSFELRLNGLRKLCRKEFGLSPKIAIIVYKVFIRPVIEYSCCAWLNIKPNKIKKLQVLQNKALRLALRAPPDTRITVLHSRTGIPTLYEHLVTKSVNFLQNCLSKNTLTGRDIRFWLNLYTDNELENTSLGMVKHLL